MKLLCDDYNQVYVWVDNSDENIELSPHFDYEDDAVQWYNRVSKDILNEDSITKGSI
jgi:hypothetical protein